MSENDPDSKMFNKFPAHYNVEWLQSLSTASSLWFGYPAVQELKNPMCVYQCVADSRDGQELTNCVGQRLCSLIDKAKDGAIIGDTMVNDVNVPGTKFFVCLSNEQNLIRSLRSWIWATREENSSIFEEALEAARKVVLIFSVKGRQSFQGYALLRRRMCESVPGSKMFKYFPAHYNVEWMQSLETASALSFDYHAVANLMNAVRMYESVINIKDGQQLHYSVGHQLCWLIDKKKVGTISTEDTLVYAPSTPGDPAAKGRGKGTRQIQRAHDFAQDQQPSSSSREPQAAAPMRRVDWYDASLEDENTLIANQPSSSRIGGSHEQNAKGSGKGQSESAGGHGVNAGQQPSSRTRSEGQGRTNRRRARGKGKAKGGGKGVPQPNVQPKGKGKTQPVSTAVGTNSGSKGRGKQGPTPAGMRAAVRSAQ